jgi:hypothetical protein
MTALHELTIKAIRRAQSQGGIVDPVEDYAAIANLDKLARASTEMVPEDRLLFLDLPLVVCNTRLYRLSWGASDWLTQLAMNWFRDDLSMLDRSVVWAHVHARMPEAFRRFSNARDAKAEIETWSQELTAPFEALMAAADQLCPKPKESETRKQHDTGPISNGPVLNRLMDDYKKPVDYFIWELSAEALEVILHANVLQEEMSDRQQMAAAGLSPAPDSRITRAILKFQRAAKDFVNAIVARNKGTK